MPLMRIIFESGQLWYKLAEGLVRLLFVPLTFLQIVISWFLEDISTAYKIFYSLCAELLHIFPCVLSQIGIMDYEPIREIIEKRNAEIEAERNFFMKIYKRIVIKYTTGVRIIRNHSFMAVGEITKMSTVWTERYRQILRLWFISKETEKYYLHDFKCLIKIILIKFSLYTPKKQREAELNKTKKRAKVSTSKESVPTNKKSKSNLNTLKRNATKTKKTSTFKPVYTVDDNLEIVRKSGCPIFNDKVPASSMTELNNNNDLSGNNKVDLEDDKENDFDTTTLKKYKLNSSQTANFSDSRKHKARRLLGISTLPPTIVEFPTNNSNDNSEIHIDVDKKPNGLTPVSFKTLPINSSKELLPENSPDEQEFSNNISKDTTIITEKNSDLKVNNLKKPSSMRKIPMTVLKQFTNKKYHKVKKAIIQAMDQKDFDDGSMGPVFVRLCWHCCATYDKRTGTGGSNGATIRLPPESTDEGNNGLMPAKIALEPIKSKFQWISYADLYTFAGVVAIEAMGGPKIDWVPGRTDTLETEFVPPNGRLPLGDGDSKHIKDVFFRMGFNIQETVCLMGTHTLGRTHSYYSGWEGKWSNDPIKFDNEFFRLLLDDEWEYGVVPETGRKQFFDKSNREIMMLNTDMEMVASKDFRVWAEIYANDEKLFFEDYAKVFAKLLELGVERNKEGIAIKKH